MSWNKKKRNKYGAKKVYTDTHTYDSKREKRCHDLLLKFKIPHKFQVEYELQPSFKNYGSSTVRRIYMVIDFIIIIDDVWLFVDVKGVITKESKLKYKFLEYKQLRLGKKCRVVFLHSDKEVDSFVLNLYEQLKM